MLLHWYSTWGSTVLEPGTSTEAGAMLKPFSRYLKAVEEYLPSEHHQLLRNGLYLAVLDWYTDGSSPERLRLELAMR